MSAPKSLGVLAQRYLRERLADVNNFFRSRHLFLSGRFPSAAVHLQ